MVVMPEQIVKIFVPAVNTYVDGVVVSIDKNKGTATVSIQGCEKEFDIKGLGYDPPA